MIPPSSPPTATARRPPVTGPGRGTRHRRDRIVLRLRTRAGGRPNSESDPERPPVELILVPRLSHLKLRELPKNGRADQYARS